jgi:hypothetical protein
MPETPDFDFWARTVVQLVDPDQATNQALLLQIREILRDQWNARGAADLAAVESSLSNQMGTSMAGPYVTNLDRALRSLDR